MSSNFTLEKIMPTLADFIAALNTKFAELGYTFVIEHPGVKYTRIVQSLRGNGRSVYCFVDVEGNIYKPAGWKAPAKGVRSTLATMNISRVDPYGSWLYR
jgi:hypothetical protein